ncbi:MAG: hypothetical protein NDI81_14615 [Desulfobacula sp.]|nr:hypothetical protein [Desulfobacula sp.]
MKLNFRYIPIVLRGLALWTALLLFTGMAQASVKPVELEYDHGLVTLRPAQSSLLAILEHLAHEAGLDIYITEAFSDGPRRTGFTKLPVYEALGTLLKGYSFAVVYGPNQGGRVFFSSGGGFLHPAEALSFQTAAVPAKASPASRPGYARVSHGPGPDNPSLASPDRGPDPYPATDAEETGRTGSIPEPGASADSQTLSASTGTFSSAGAGSPSAGSSPASRAEAGNTDPDGEAGSDEDAGQLAPVQETAASQQNGLDTKSSLEYKIQKLEQEIESGQADQFYNSWATKKDPRYIYNHRDELARYQKELEKLNSN